MDFPDRHDRLTQIETLTSVMTDARGEGDPAVKARQTLVMLYYGAAYRYILAILRNENTAQEIAQNFAIRFMQGDFVRQADPGRGRFRDYLKRSLHNLVIDHLRRQRNLSPLPEDSGALPAREAPPPTAGDTEFLTSLREELLARSWDALAKFEKESGALYHTVLKHKTENPEARSAQIAADLGARLGRSFTESGMRQLLHRARDKFVDLLLEEAVILSDFAGDDKLEDLLSDLQLIEYCRTALDKRTKKG